MTDVHDPDALSEATLRGALRLDPDERPARFDAAAIVSAAEHRGAIEQLLRFVRGTALIGAGLGIEAAIAVAAFAWVSELDPSGLFAFVLATLAGVAERAIPLAGLATDPSVATATLAALVFATAYERIRGKESVRVQAS